jgi:hypothetical protein
VSFVTGRSSGRFVAGDFNNLSLQSCKANARVVRATFQNQHKAYRNTALLPISNKLWKQHRLSEIAYSSHPPPH